MQEYRSPPAGVVITQNDRQRTIRGLGLTQLIIGGLAFILGLISVVIGMWMYHITHCIWGGIWILVTGILGVVLSKKSNGCLGGTYLAFSIVSTVISCGNSMMLGSGIAYYKNMIYDSCNNKRCLDFQAKIIGLYLPMLILMIVEFFISIVASVYCCKSNIGCCAPQQQQHIVVQTQQQHPYQILNNQSYPAVTVASHQPQHAGVATTVPGQTYQPVNISQQTQIVSSQYNQGAMNLLVSMPNTGAMYVPSQGQPNAGHTNIVYSGQTTAPPPYNQFNEETKKTAGPLSC